MFILELVNCLKKKNDSVRVVIIKLHFMIKKMFILFISMNQIKKSSNLEKKANMLVLERLYLNDILLYTNFILLC